jgi:hypothetical protein
MFNPGYLARLSAAPVLIVGGRLAYDLILGYDETKKWVYLVFTSILSILLAMFWNVNSVTISEKSLASAFLFAGFVFLTGVVSFYLALTQKQEGAELGFGLFTTLFGIFLINLVVNCNLFFETWQFSKLKAPVTMGVFGVISTIGFFFFCYKLAKKRGAFRF